MAAHISRSVTAKVDADLPESVAVGEATRKTTVSVRTTVDAHLTSMIQWLHVRSIQGTVDAKIGVTAPEGRSQVPVSLGVPRTSVPASGSFEVKATGSAPARTFHRPGTARITAGDLVLRVTGKKADGSVLCTLTAPCTLDRGQPDVIGPFEITGTDTPPSSSPSDAPGNTHGATTGTIAATGQDSMGLVLPALGALAAGVAACCVGAGLRSRRRAGRRG